MIYLRTLHHEVGYPVTNVFEIKTWLEEVVLNMDVNNIITNILDNNFKVNLFCQGSSGAICATTLALLLEKFGIKPKICHIKKENEFSHNRNSEFLSFCFDDFFYLNSYNIIIDDFSVTGNTLNNVYSICNKYLGKKGFKVNCLIVSDVRDCSKISFEPHTLISRRNFSE